MQAARGTPLTSTVAPTASRRRILQFAAVALVVLTADILTKIWVVAELSDRAIVVIDGVLILAESRNSGAAFGIATGATVLLSAVALAVVVGILRIATRLRSRAWGWSLGLVLGGALGNLVDRLFRSPGPFRGHVVDFIDLRWWPSFNVADSAIVVGGALAVLLATAGVAIDGSPPSQPDEPAS